MTKHLFNSGIFIFIFIITFFINISESVASEHKSVPLILEQTSERIDLHPSIDLIKDRHDEYTIDDLLREDVANQFTNINNIKQKKGFFHSSNWLRFTIQNNSTQDDWLLEFSFPLVHELQIYTIENGHVEMLYNTGADFPFKQRPINHRNFVLPLNIETGATKTYYAYAVGSGDLHPPIIVWDQEAFMNKSQIEFLLLGIFYGVSLVMILYNLFLYLSLRLNSYLFYVIAISFILLGKLSINGLGYQYLWPNFPKWNVISTTIWVALAFIFILIFSYQFLDIKRYIPSYKKYYYTLIAINLTVIFSILISRYIALMLMIIVSVITIISTLTVAIICLKRGAREARFFILGWVIFLTGVTLTMLERATVVPYSVVTEYAGQMALTFEVVLFSLALADKINIIRMEKQIAEKKALENRELAIQNLKKADELKDEFLAITSHELRTPLYGMIGIAESLKEGAAGEIHEKMNMQLSMIINSGKRLTQLVNEILDFSKLKYEQLELDLKPVKIDTVLQIVLTILHPILQNKPIKLINKIDQSLPTVVADENRLQQILYNLLDNAIKYTDEGTIEVFATVKKGTLTIHVKDSGPGISEGDIEKIFQPFQQGGTSISRKVGGVGIGLNVTKSLVELHDGKLSVHSEIEKGSTFSITLNIHHDMKQKKPSTIKIEKDVLKEGSNLLQFPQPFKKGNPKILVVDDEVVNVQVLMNQLSLEGYDVLTSLKGEDVFSIVKNNPVDLIILDIMMPGMSGYEVSKRLRQTYTLMDLPILMLTAKNQLQDKMLAFEAGANDYLAKPCDRQELLSRVRTLINVKKLNEDIIQMNQSLELKVKERTKELNFTNKNLQEVAKSRRQLLANIAHELGTPVTIIHHYVQSIQQNLIPIDDQHYNQLVTEKINVLNRLIEDLYHLSILEAGNVRFNLKELPLYDFLQQIIDTSKITVQQSGRKFSYQKLSDELKQYICSIDVQRIDQLFSNLISNAVKNTADQSGVISINITMEENDVVVALTDNGKGIDKKDLPYIFERFYKQQHASNVTPGTGLGLAIVKQIVDNHGGKIKVKSEVNMGTTFFVYFPVKRIDATDTTQSIEAQ